MLYEGEGRDQGDVSTSQGTPDIVRRPLEGKQEVWNRFSLTALEERNLADMFILDF